MKSKLTTIVHLFCFISFTLDAQIVELSGNKVPLFVVWGESNIPGWGQNELADSFELQENPRVQLMKAQYRIFPPPNNPSFSNLKFETISDNANEISGNTYKGHGIELQLSNYAKEDLFGDTLYLVKQGWGGTSFRHWEEGSNYFNDKRIKEDLDSAYIQIRRKGFEPIPFFVLSLGINDVWSATKPTKFKEQTKEIINRYRKYIDYPAPVCLTKIPTSCTVKKYNVNLARKFNSMYEEIIQEENAIFLIEVNDIEMYECGHYDYEGWKVLTDQILDKFQFLPQKENFLTSILTNIYHYFNLGCNDFQDDRDKDGFPNEEEVRLGFDPDDLKSYPTNPIVFKNFCTEYKKSRMDDISVIGFDNQLKDNEFIYYEDFSDTIIQANDVRFKRKKGLDFAKIKDGKLVPNKNDNLSKETEETLGIISIGISNKFNQLELVGKNLQIRLVNYFGKELKQYEIKEGSNEFSLDGIPEKNIFIKIKFLTNDAFLDFYKVKFQKLINKK